MLEQIQLVAEEVMPAFKDAKPLAAE